MKKVISMLLVLALSLLISVPAFASEDDEETIQYPDFFANAIPDTVEVNESLIELIQSLRMKKAYGQAKTLTVPHYYQNGQDWSADIVLPSSETIGNIGCCITSFAMIAKYYGNNVNPGDVNDAMGNGAYDFHFATAGQLYGLSVAASRSASTSNSVARDFIGGAIMMGWPVIVGMVNASGGTHYVTAYAYIDLTLGSSAQIYIHDPAMQRDYTTLDQYFNAGYSVMQMVAYK